METLGLFFKSVKDNDDEIRTEKRKYRRLKKTNLPATEKWIYLRLKGHLKM